MVLAMFVWVLSVISFLIGYLIGRKTDVPQAIDQVTRSVKERLNPPKYGIISKPTPEEYNKRKSKRYRETEEAMTETLDEVLEDDGI